MDYLHEIYISNSPEAWIRALGITLIVSVALFFTLRVIARRLEVLARRTENRADDLLVDMLRSTRWYVVLAWGGYLGIQQLNFEPSLAEILPSVLVLFTLLQVGIWGNRIIGYWIHRMVEERMSEDPASATTMSGLRFVARLILISVLVLLGLDNLGVNITTLVAGLGVGGIAVALALQNILGDLFASLSIILDKPFQIGDFIVIEDFAGTVEHIGLKTTRIRSLSGEQIIFSNAGLLGSRIRNFKRMAERRILFTIGVTYQTPAETLKTIPGMLREIITKQAKVRFDRAHFKAYGDSSLIFEVVYFVLSSEYNEYMNIQQEVNLEIYSRFAAQKIDFAYPTRTVFLTQEPAKQ